MKTRMSLLPWDCLCQSPDIDTNTLVKLAKLWWTRRAEQLPPVLPKNMLQPVAKVLTFGAQKYSSRGWETDSKFHSASQHFDAMMRHATHAEQCDEETGFPNAWHVACRYIMLAALQSRALLVDDRPPAQFCLWDEDEIEITIDATEGEGLGGALS
jgi:hypothetical protein